jgi:hypothetical protein
VPVIPALIEQREEEQELQASLAYIVRPSPLKKKNKDQNHMVKLVCSDP